MDICPIPRTPPYNIDSQVACVTLNATTDEPDEPGCKVDRT